MKQIKYKKTLNLKHLLSHRLVSRVEIINLFYLH